MPSDFLCLVPDKCFVNANDNTIVTIRMCGTTVWNNNSTIQQKRQWNEPTKLFGKFENLLLK